MLHSSLTSEDVPIKGGDLSGSGVQPALDVSTR